jgi:hypothetical protein
MEGAKRKAEGAPEEEKGTKKAFTLQADLIELAEEFKKSAGVISDAEAHSLWQAALDGPGVTQNEFATLEHIMTNFKFTDKARAYLSKLVTQTKTGKSRYQVIDKVRYDRSCLDSAAHLAKDGRLDVADAKLLWENVEDGPGVTQCEKRSIEYVMGKYTLTDGAKKYFDDQIAAWKPPVQKLPPTRVRKHTQKKFTLQIDLVQLAEEAIKSGGVISDAEAHKLWESALDGPGVTHNEFATLEYILSNFKFTEKAQKYLEDLVIEKASGTSFYKVVGGIRYDRSALDLATHLVKDGKLDVGDAQQLWCDVEDGNRVTEVEKRTIEHIMKEFTLTDGAKKFFEDKLAALPQKTETPAPTPADVATPDAMSAAIDLIWASYDTDKSGDLDKTEAKNFTQHFLVFNGATEKYTDEFFDEVFAANDADKSGTIDKSEMPGFVRQFFAGMEKK